MRLPGGAYPQSSWQQALIVVSNRAVHQALEVYESRYVAKQTQVIQRLCFLEFKQKWSLSESHCTSSH